MENYFRFIEVIDKWLEKSPDAKEGAFRFLNKSTFVRNIVMSSLRMINEASLKTFFDLNILYIYEESSSKVTHKTIERYLNETLGKKYCFDFSRLSEMADQQKNAEAMLEDFTFDDKISKSVYRIAEELPYVLLKSLKDTAFFYLKQYWKENMLCLSMADINTKSPADKMYIEEESEKLQESYGTALLSITLFEIFVREYLIEHSIFMKQDWKEKYEQEVLELNALTQKLENMAALQDENLFHTLETESSELMERMEQVFVKAENIKNKAEESFVFLTIMQEFYQELYADIMILMLVERGAYVHFEGTYKLFSYFVLDNVVTGIAMDHNKRKFYKNACAYMDTILGDCRETLTTEKLKKAVAAFLFSDKERMAGRKMLAEPVHKYMTEALEK